MSSKENNFDAIAPVYDFLVKVVFGRSMMLAQTSHFRQLPSTGHVLIIGGGTGWIAAHLLKARPDFTITYIEASNNMLAIAKRTLRHAQSKVKFVHGTQRDIPKGIQFDVVITNFFLDLFEQRDLEPLLIQIKKSLLPGGYWVVTDFVSGKRWHRLMLKLMYTFFGLTSRIRAKQLPQWVAALRDVGIPEIESKDFYGGFIRSSLYRTNE